MESLLPPPVPRDFQNPITLRAKRSLGMSFVVLHNQLSVVLR